MTVMKQNIRVLIYPDETGGYNVQCTDLGAYSQGDTLEEALVNMREVLALALEDENLAELGYVNDPALLVEIELGPASQNLDTPEVRRAG
jgi:predicted RNase H-like HicB family nuclease